MPIRKSSLFYGLLIALTSVVAGMVLASRLDLTPDSFARDMSVPAANSAPLDGPLDATTFRDIAAEADPTVVNITVRSRREANPSIMEFFFEDPGSEGPQVQQGAGSGFIIDADEGYILTNNHVVAGALEIDVRLSGMEFVDAPLRAEVVGRDELTDAALIKLLDAPRTPLVASKFGDSDQMMPGDWVMAIGSPFGLTNTVTVGVVSASAREQSLAVRGRTADMIQTDAAINRGNSGGPLLNIRGEVVGINTMIVSNNLNGGNLGIGFAVPINTIRDILPQLETGKVTRGRIGVEVSRIPITEADAELLGLPGTNGAEVTQVAEGGPAAEAGIQIGDVITRYNSEAVRDNSHLVDLVTATTPGTRVPVEVYRGGERVTLNATIEELNLDTERGMVPTRAPRETPRPEPTDTGYGMTIDALTADAARQLRVPEGRGGAIVVGVEPFSPAAQAFVSPRDVILRVNNQEVTSVDEVSAALDVVPAGATARIIVWRVDPSGARETLLLVRKR
jgi:serine protease Do